MLQTWEAERLEGFLPGRTNPLVVECSKSEPVSLSDTGTDDPTSTILIRRPMVVKATGLPEITNFGLFNEVFGNLLARALGINTPSPCLVQISDDFIAASRNVLAGRGLNLRPGIASGCEYFTHGFSNVSQYKLTTSDELAQASSLYAFDLLVQNPDRTPRRPNCAIRSGQFMVYDFETAFSFVLLIGDSAFPWEVSRHGIGPKHLFFSSLREKKAEVSWTSVVTGLRDISPDRLKSMTSALPIDWCEYFERIEKHILEVRGNLQEFQLELQRSLL